MQGGILSLDQAPDNVNLLATAGADGTVVLFDRDAGRIRTTLTGHSKKINSEHILKPHTLHACSISHISIHFSTSVATPQCHITLCESACLAVRQHHHQISLLPVAQKEVLSMAVAQLLKGFKGQGY